MVEAFEARGFTRLAGLPHPTNWVSGVSLNCTFFFFPSDPVGRRLFSYEPTIRVKEHIKVGVIHSWDVEIFLLRVDRSFSLKATNA